MLISALLSIHIFVHSTHLLISLPVKASLLKLQPAMPELKIVSYFLMQIENLCSEEKRISQMEFDSRQRVVHVHLRVNCRIYFCKTENLYVQVSAHVGMRQEKGENFGHCSPLWGRSEGARGQINSSFKQPYNVHICYSDHKMLHFPFNQIGKNEQ